MSVSVIKKCIDVKKYVFKKKKNFDYTIFREVLQNFTNIIKNNMDNITEQEEILVFDQTAESNDPVISEEVASDQNEDPLIYYNELISMFPNIDAKYIEEICIKPPFKKVENNDYLGMLVNYFLCYDDKIDENMVELFKNEDKQNNVPSGNDELLAQYIENQEQQTNDAVLNDELLSEMLEVQEMEDIEKQKRDEEKLNAQLFLEFLEQDAEIVDEKMEIVTNILPDANPEELRKFIEQNIENMDSIDQFVESKLSNKNYEKRDQYYERKQNEKMLDEYINHFKVEKFIKQFPDSFEYFEDPGRHGTFQEKALNFLKYRYNSYPSQEVTKIYSSSNYNLSLADKHLQRLSTCKPIVQFNIDINDKLLLQEIAFIQNKNSIKNHLELIKQEKEKQMNLLRAQNLLLECQCCFDELNPVESVECDNDENHIFCIDCVIRGTKHAISNGETFVYCFKGCRNEIPINVLQKVLPPITYDVLIEKRQEMEVKAANLDNLITCPFCPYSMELAPEIKIFTCKNPQCMKITCRLCKKKNHLPIKCEDVIDEHKGRLIIEEAMSEALIRYCYRCYKPFIKASGCNKMTCPCGAMMCYICKQPIQDYNHFEFNNCKTNQNSNKFDQEQIELKRVEAATKLRRDFPDLEIPQV